MQAIWFYLTKVSRVDFNFKDIESQGFNLVDSFMVGELELKIYEYRFGELEPKIISFISGADAVVHVLGKSKGYSIKLADSCRYIDTQSKEILGHQ